MAAQSYTTYKALTYGQVAERYKFVLTDTTKENEYIVTSNVSSIIYPFSSGGGTDPSLSSNWIKPSHNKTDFDLFTEDFEYIDDYITISIPSRSATGKDNIRTFNAYLVQTGYLSTFRSKYNSISSEDLSKLRISISISNFNAGTLKLSNLYWYSSTGISRLYTTNPNGSALFISVVSISDINVTSANTINHKMKSTHDPDFSTTYDKFFTHSYKALT